jgi:hypothetical protein
MSEEKRFANMYWNYEDVQFNAGYVSREKAEEFLSSIEKYLFRHLAEMGNEFIRSAWMDEHPDWEFKDEEDEDEEEEKEEPIVEASPPAMLIKTDSLGRVLAERDGDGRVLLKGDGKFVLKSDSEIIIIGKVVNGETVPLSAEDIEFCHNKRLKMDLTLGDLAKVGLINLMGDNGFDTDEDDEDKEEPTVEESPAQIGYEYTCDVCQKVCDDETFSKAELDTPICDDCDKYIIKWDNMDFGTEKEPQCGICEVPQEDAYYRHGQLIEDVICWRCIECWYYDSDMDVYMPRTSFEGKVLNKKFLVSNMDNQLRFTKRC